MQVLSERARLRRPPLVVLSVNAESESTFVISTPFKPAAVKLHRDKSNAAEPATCGAACDVPLKVPYVLLRSVLKMILPGAPRCTVLLPQFEKKASASRLSVATTEIIPGSL